MPKLAPLTSNSWLVKVNQNLFSKIIRNINWGTYILIFLKSTLRFCLNPDWDFALTHFEILSKHTLRFCLSPAYDMK